MKLKQSLIGKFIALIVGMLLSFFFIILLFIQIVSDIFIYTNIHENIYVQQEVVDETIDSIVYEAITIYSRMFTTQNISTLTSSLSVVEKESFYQQAYLNSRINQFYEGIVSFIGDEVYTSSTTLVQPDMELVSEMATSDHRIEFATVIHSNHEAYVVLAKQIIDPTYPSKKVVGVAFYYLKESVLQDLCKQVASANGSTFLVHHQDYVFSHQDPNVIGSRIFDTDSFPFLSQPNYIIKEMNGVNSIVIVSPLELVNESYDFSMHIVTILPYDEVYNSISNLRLIIVLFTAIMLIVASFITVSLVRGLLKPINILSSKLQHVSFEEKANLLSQNMKGDELYQLEKTYDDMIDRIFKLMKKNQEDMETQRKLELDSLQMQINPHFLYNTLDAIAWMAKIQKQPQIEKLVLSLAKFFRISLHKGDKFISVVEEIELIQHFIEIELIRFPNKFDITYEVAEEVKDYQTLKLILQPIVENAIKHGISPITKMGHIEIKVYAIDDDILFEVIDDGIGFEPPSDLLSKKDPTQKGGFGLFNVNERIKLEYGPQYGLSIASSIGGGTKITVRIHKRI